MMIMNRLVGGLTTGIMVAISSARLLPQLMMMMMMVPLQKKQPGRCRFWRRLGLQFDYLAVIKVIVIHW